MADLRVGIDVSPLELTRAGTARYLRKLLSALEREPGLELRGYLFPGSSRSAKIRRDTAWYLGALPLVTLSPSDPRGWQFAVKYAVDRLVAAFLAAALIRFFR